MLFTKTNIVQDVEAGVASGAGTINPSIEDKPAIIGKAQSNNQHIFQKLRWRQWWRQIMTAAAISHYIQQ